MRSLLLFLLCVMSLQASDIAVVTIAHGKAYQDSVELGTKSKRAYCEKHGYDFICREDTLDPSRTIVWSKIPLILKLFENPSYQWVVWIDADTLIMNQDVPLEDLLYENVNFCIGQAWNGINAGVFFIRNCEWSKQFLANVYSHTECLYDWGQEQTAISRALQESPEFGSLVKIVPQRLFNSMPSETISLLSSTYQPGDFLIHFAGNNDRGDLSTLIQKYAPLALNDRKLITLDEYLGYYGLHLSSNERQQYRERLFLYPHTERILQIGLNGGRGADIFLQKYKNLKKFVSFDHNGDVYTQPAVDYLKRTYKGEFEFIEGDLAFTIPQYASRFPNQKFDLIDIDGTHTYEEVCVNILNCRKLARPNTILWIDACRPTIQDAIALFQKVGIIRLVHEQKSSGEHGERSWIEARYIFSPTTRPIRRNQ